MTEEKIRRAYKVVREEDGAWKSAIIGGKACVTYAPGQRSLGFEGTPITVFLSVGQARSWRGRRNFRLLVGRAGNPQRQRRLVDMGPFYDGGHWLRVLRRFWKRGDAYQGRMMAAPAGTHVADWFQPEKQVQP